MRTRAPALFLALAALAACNEAPGPAVVGIDPSQPLTTDDLVASLLSEASDPNSKDEISYSYKWFQDGTERTDLTGTTVSAANTAKGESWRVLVTPSDGELDGPSSEEEVIVLNTPPVATVSLTPEVPTTEDDIEAVVSAEDDDGDEVTYTYAWTVNGNNAASAEATLPADQTERGVVELTVTPNDGEEDGEPVVVTVDVDNTAPVVNSVLLEPSEAYETTTLEVTAEAEDADGDEITLTYAWTVDGTVVQEGDGTTLTGELFDKHQEVHVEVTANDGFVDGDVVASEVVTILNSVPSISQVTLDPTDIYEETEVTCVPAGWSDDDGDDEGYAYEWTVEGAVVGTNSTLTGDSFDKGQEVICTVTPTDGDHDGTAVSSVPTTVGNTAPSIGSATLSSTAPVEGDTLSVTLNTVWDADGDSVSHGYAWYVSGSVVATTETLSSDYFAKGESVYVVVTPNDGTDDGAAVTSDTATVQNSPPTVISVSISPSTVYTDSTISAAVTTSDADGDSVSLSYAWYVDGAAAATSSSLSGTTWFDRGQSVTVTVTPDDGTDSGTAMTSTAETVVNTPPEAPMISIAPDDPGLVDDLVCLVDTDSPDADGDGVTYTMTWTVDGASFTATGTTTWPGDTVFSSRTSAEDLWTCTATPDDGDDEGTSASATVLLPNEFTGWSSWETSAADADYAFEGTIDDEWAGRVVDGAGDVDGDGLADLIVGGSGDDDAGDAAGTAYLILGSSLGVSGTASLSAADHRLQGVSAYDYAGHHVAGVGDVDGDGLDDVLVGAYGVDDGGVDAGAAYLVLGSSLGSGGALTLTDADFAFVGETDGDYAGNVVAGAGDIDGDGLLDLAITASKNDSAAVDAGKVYLVLAGSLGSPGAVTLSSADVLLLGEIASDNAGVGITSAGDVDGDGLGDIFVGAIYSDVAGNASGQAYLLLGSTLAGASSLSLADADWVMPGEAPEDRLGRKLCTPGDVDGDGLDDLLVGASLNDSAGADAGKVYLVLAGSLPSSSSIDPAAVDYAFLGETAGAWAGGDVAGADYDGDGLGDLLVGSYGVDDAATNAGRAYLFLAANLGGTGTYSLATADYAFSGHSAGEEVGYSVAAAGDVNDDGLEDVLLGGWLNDEAHTHAGKAYLFLSP